MSKLSDYSKFDHLEVDSPDDEHHDEHDTITGNASASASASVPVPVPFTTNKVVVPGSNIRRVEKRYIFEYDGNRIYEFEQGLDDITIYVLPPPYIQMGRQIKCIITAHHLKLGLVDHSSAWFLNEDTFGTVDVDESTWTLEDCDEENYSGGSGSNKKNDDGSRRKVIVITLIKANRGTAWEAALNGNRNNNNNNGRVTATHIPAAKNSSSLSASNVPAAQTIDALSMEQVKKDLLLERFQEENPGFDFRDADFNGSIPDARNFMGGIKPN